MMWLWLVVPWLVLAVAVLAVWWVGWRERTSRGLDRVLGPDAVQWQRARRAGGVR